MPNSRIVQTHCFGADAEEIGLVDVAMGVAYPFTERTLFHAIVTLGAAEVRSHR